ncbi:MAG: DUF2815 family protein [Gammaproteobacteria bacterium]|nr:DUF2815 family protein [Gammaproteobacteria bacterium]
MRVTGIARYAHVANPSAPKGTDNIRHSLNVLIAKTDPQCAMIQQEFDQVKANGFPSGMPPKADVCWADLAVTEPGNLHVAGYMSLVCNTKVEHGRPDIVDEALQPIIDPGIDGRMTGMIVHVDTSMLSYTLGTQGVKAYLNGVMVTQQQGPIPKDALSSKPDARAMFGDLVPTLGVPPTTTVTPLPEVSWSVPAPAAPVPAAPVPAAPTPAPPPAPPAPSAPVGLIMTAAAGGTTYEAYVTAGWSDDQMIQAGVAQRPTFG